MCGRPAGSRADGGGDACGLAAGTRAGGRVVDGRRGRRRDGQCTKYRIGGAKISNAPDRFYHVLNYAAPVKALFLPSDALN